MRAANFAFSPDRPSSCTSTDCIWFLCRRTVRYILTYATNVSMKAKAAVNEMRKSRVTRDSHTIIKETNALNTQMKITTTTTRLWVTTSWYLRWSWTAKNLSTLTATTPRKEIVENTEPEIFMIRWALQPGLFNCNHLTRSDVWNGWANKSTPKSEKAKLKSRVFKVFFIVEVFYIAQIVTKFNVIVVYVKKLLKIQLAIKVERRSLSSVCSGKYCEDSLQFNSFMMLTHLSWMQEGNFVNFTGVISTYFPDLLFCGQKWGWANSFEAYDTFSTHIVIFLSIKSYSSKIIIRIRTVTRACVGLKLRIQIHSRNTSTCQRTDRSKYLTLTVWTFITSNSS